MKEIKYRAWNKHSKEMLEIIQINFRDNYLDYSDVNSENGIKRLLLKEVELMQSTGTYDDGGTEIYVGDIIFSENEDGFCLFLVKFGENEKLPETVFASFYLKPIKQFEFSYEADSWNENDVSAIDIIEKYNPEQKDFFIIGNKFQNPELLEVKE